jgi:hypothetical protein
MKKHFVTAEQAEKIKEKLPAGRTIDEIRLIRVSAKIEDTKVLDPAEAELVAKAVETSGAPPLITDGRPTIMRIVAWMCHEGVNLNRQAFLADEMGPAADVIRIPNVLPMDWNHSAFRSMSMDDKAIGVWYSAEKRWDAEAKDGKGAYGILVQGIMWSWLFPKYAQEMMATMQRDGELLFSMACLPTSVETVRGADDKEYEILHNPVFLTNSALDVPPADPDADGLGVEGSSDPNLESNLRHQLLADKGKQQFMNGPDVNAPPAESASLNTNAKDQEEGMEELMKQATALKEQLATAMEQLASLTLAQEELTRVKAELEAATAEIEKLKTEMTEVASARDALQAAATVSAGEVEKIKAELETAKAKLAEIAAAEEAEKAVARYAERKAKLPQSYREALEKRSEEERNRFEKKWTAASDEDWTEFSSEIAFAFKDVRISYLERSQKEGGELPNAGEESDDMKASLAAIKR